MKIALIGAAGGIGQPLALLLKLQLPEGSTLALYDVVNTPGVGVDLSHINTPVKLETYLGDMKNPNNPEIDKALSGAHIVVIPAGVPRKPGMTRDDLFNVNAGILKGIIESVAKNCPNALIGVITNPVNSTIPIAAEVLKAKGVYNPKKLFGISTLDVVRAETFVGESKGKNPLKLKIDVVGGHSPETMIPVFSALKDISFTQDEIVALTTRVKNAGTEVVDAKQGAGSATLSMAYAGARFVSSLIKGLQGEKNIVECSYVQVENMEVAYFAVPVELGKGGIEKIHPLPALNDYEKSQLKEAIPILKGNIEKGIQFGKGS